MYSLLCLTISKIRYLVFKIFKNLQTQFEKKTIFKLNEPLISMIFKNLKNLKNT